jgi:hypothetical protein
MENVANFSRGEEFYKNIVVSILHLRSILPRIQLFNKTTGSHYTEIQEFLLQTERLLSMLSVSNGYNFHSEINKLHSLFMDLGFLAIPTNSSVVEESAHDGKLDLLKEICLASIQKIKDDMRIVANDFAARVEELRSTKEGLPGEDVMLILTGCLKLEESI